MLSRRQQQRHKRAGDVAKNRSFSVGARSGTKQVAIGGHFCGHGAVARLWLKSLKRIFADAGERSGGYGERGESRQNVAGGGRGARAAHLSLTRRYSSSCSAMTSAASRMSSAPRLRARTRTAAAATSAQSRLRTAAGNCASVVILLYHSSVTNCVQQRAGGA